MLCMSCVLFQMYNQQNLCLNSALKYMNSIIFRTKYFWFKKVLHWKFTKENIFFPKNWIYLDPHEVQLMGIV